MLMQCVMYELKCLWNTRHFKPKGPMH